MNRADIRTLLTGFNDVDVNRFITYCNKLDNDTKTGWMLKIPNEKLADAFKKVAKEGLVFDGVHVTLGSNGISYDYIAYKNRMLNVYPESIIDTQLVYKEDLFSFSKDSGKVIYNHSVKNPFGQKDDDVVGAYCVIKNKRGEFLTTLSAEDITKHRKVAKTDNIWRSWFKEMCLKTVIKKGVKVHFDDIYFDIDEEDNKNYDPDQVISPPKNKETLAEIQEKVSKTLNTEDLKSYYETIEVKTQPITAMFTLRKEQLSKLAK